MVALAKKFLGLKMFEPTCHRIMKVSEVTGYFSQTISH
jgi:hypothetical protein